MPKFLDFADIKRTYSILDVAQMLRIQLQKEPTTYRGDCPKHPSKDPKSRKFVITPTKGEHGAFFCSVDGKGGYDCISFAAHVLECGQKEAADAITKHFGYGKSTSKGTSTSTSEPEGARSEGTEKPQLRVIAERLEPDHLAVEALNICPNFAKEHGIGYDGRGTMRGHVLIPFRDEHGTLLGYVGVPPDADIKIPADFMGKNIVPFEKKSA